MFLFFKDALGEMPEGTVVSGQSERENRGKAPGYVFGFRAWLKGPTGVLLRVDGLWSAGLLW